jgi:hypothetical protein
MMFGGYVYFCISKTFLKKFNFFLTLNNLFLFSDLVLISKIK